jgi:hypothetical protein
LIAAVNHLSNLEEETLEPAEKIINILFGSPDEIRGQFEFPEFAAVKRQYDEMVKCRTALAGCFDQKSHRTYANFGDVFESNTDVREVETSIHELNALTDKINLDKLRKHIRSLEDAASDLVKVINTKQQMMTDPNSEIWVEDVRTGERVPTPTVIIIDTVAALQSKQVMEEKEKMGSLLFESGAQAKANNAFAQRLSGMIGDPNITIYAVNHIRVDPGPSGGPPKAKRIQYLNQDETCPGGTGFPQYADYFLKMVPCESFTNKMDEGFAIPGKLVRCTIVKSRLSYDGRQFELVMTDSGFSNAWSNLHFLKKEKLVKGAGAHLFIEAPDGRQTQKFAQRNWAELYEGDATFREIADACLEVALLNLVPQPGSQAEAEVQAEAEAAATE